MSPLETRSWLQLAAMGPPYLVYFTLQVVFSGWFDTLNIFLRLACFGATALTHAAISVVGLLMLKRGERREDMLADERDRAIEARATLFGYYALMTGMIVVGVMMPFGRSGWRIVNPALLAIVVAEMLRHALIVLSYRKATRFAH